MDAYTVVLTVIGFFLTRAIAKADTREEDLSKLNIRVTKLEMINEAQWRHIDELKEKIKEEKNNEAA